jgi:hypothetical protein
MTDLILADWSKYIVGASVCNGGGANQVVLRFDNGYGASVIRGGISYGAKYGLFELAVVTFDNNGAHHLCYDTPITDDVLGNLDSQEVISLFAQIQALPDYRLQLEG